MKNDIIMFLCVVVWTIILIISEVWNRLKRIEIKG